MKARLLSELRHLCVEIDGLDRNQLKILSDILQSAIENIPRNEILQKEVMRVMKRDDPETSVIKKRIISTFNVIAGRSNEAYRIFEIRRAREIAEKRRQIFEAAEKESRQLKTNLEELEKIQDFIKSSGEYLAVQFKFIDLGYHLEYGLGVYGVLNLFISIEKIKGLFEIILTSWMPGKIEKRLLRKEKFRIIVWTEDGMPSILRRARDALWGKLKIRFGLRSDFDKTPSFSLLSS